MRQSKATRFIDPPEKSRQILLTVRHARLGNRRPHPRQRLVHRTIDLDALHERPLAMAEGAFGGDADLVDTRLARRRLDAVDELAHLALELVERRQEVRLEDDEEIAVLVLEVERRAGKHA